jgi:Tol biopolymer transport system component
VRSDIKRLKRETDSERSPTAAAELLLPARRRRRASIPAAVLLAVAALGVIGVFWLRVPLPPPRVLSTSQLTSDNQPKESLVTDGPRLYFVERINERGVLSQVSASGGEISQIPTPFVNAFLHDVSPARSELLVDSFSGEETFLSYGEGAVWIVPVPAGSPRRLGDFLANAAAWSRDGQQLAYARGHHIYLAKLDGTQGHELITIAGSCADLQFSPDAMHLRFTARGQDVQSFNLWEVGIDGKGLRPLLPLNFHQDPGECCGRWSADGRYYFFAAYHNSRGDIWALQESSGIRKRSPDPFPITTGPLGYASPTPALSGNRLFVIGEQLRAELQRLDLKSRQFVSFLNGISAGEIDFSRDGRWVTYTSYPEGLLWRSRSDGSEKLQLSNAPMSVSMPRWSPDGRQIAFVCVLPGKPQRIRLVSADGGTTEEIQPDDQYWEDDPQWSPDGKSLVFARYPQGIVSSRPEDFSVLQVDFQTRKISTMAGGVGMLGPRWSPDGHYISTFSADTKKVMLLDLRTGKWSELATGRILQYPNWSPDSKFVYFQDLGSDGPEIDRVAVMGAKKERVVALKGVRRVPMPDSGAPWNGVAPDGSPLILRDAGSRELYSLELQLP